LSGNKESDGLQGGDQMRTENVLAVRLAARASATVVEAVAILAVVGCGAFGLASPVVSPQPPPTVDSTQTPAVSASAKSDLERALLDLVSGSGQAALAVVESSGQSWRWAIGEASDGPAQPNARFEIASTTKSFTATVVLQLVGEGRLSLDDSLENVLPGRIEEGGQITIRQLLNHTSGIEGGMYFGSQGSVQSTPGTKFSYSNTNYFILGEIVEELTGQPLNVVVGDRIFRPLGLKESSFGSSSLGTPAESLPPWLGGAVSGNVYDGAGGIVSTADDLATFYRALVRGKLVREAQLADMLQTVETNSDPLAARGAGVTRAGLGIFSIELDCGTPWGHGGDLPGYSNQVLVSRDGAKVVIVAQNTTGWPSASATAAEMYCL
jgi:D-alanyl-D-alanine carboxypeptidase